MEDFETRYQKKHKMISLWKSWIRIGAAMLATIITVIFTDAHTSSVTETALALSFMVFCGGFILAEFLGIAEESI